MNEVPSRMPLVSVVIPAYNAAGWIGQTLDSVRKQTWQNLEIIVVDDESKDDTRAVALARAGLDSRIRVISIQNRGCAGARNAGIEVSAGAFVALVDADDLWHPNKIERQMAAMGADPEVGYAYTLYRRIDAQDRVLYSSAEEALEGRVFLRSVLYNFVGCGGSSMLIRRAALDEAGLFNSDLRHCEDWLMQIIVSRTWKVRAVAEYLVGYRQVQHSLSTDMEMMARAQRDVLACVARRFPDLPAGVVAAAEARLGAALALSRFRERRFSDATRALVRSLRLDPLLVASTIASTARRSLTSARERRAGRPAPTFAMAGRDFHALDPREGRERLDRGYRRRSGMLARQEDAFVKTRGAHDQPFDPRF